MKVQVLVDTPSSWIIPYAKQLVERINKFGHQANFLSTHEEVEKGDILALLSCEKLFKDLELNTYNLVVHESDLPKGKGWSPLTWQILEGKNKIPVTLFEADKKVDSGPIYDQKIISFEGHELLPELKHMQGEATVELIMNFIEKYPNVKGNEQKGESSYYPKRTIEDSELDTSKSVDELFNLLRVCDNSRYPAYFEKKGIKYYLKIEKA